MTYTRIIPVVPILNGQVVQSLQFSRFLPLGSAEHVIEQYDRWGADEIIVVDISHARNAIASPDFDLIKKISRRCHTPLTVGGGIRKIDHIKSLLESGADKVCVNFCLDQPNFLFEASNYFGNQCLIASIDIGLLNSRHTHFKFNGTKAQETPIDKLIDQLNESPVGEVFLNTIHKDGSKSGFDLELIAKFLKGLNKPLIPCGGAGQHKHFEELMELKVEAIAAGNFFSFSEHSIPKLKSFLSKKYNIRKDETFDYDQFEFKDSRLLKRDEQYLEDLKYMPPTREII